MARSSRVWVPGASAVVLAACGQPNHAAHLHRTLQENTPETLLEDPACPDVDSAEPGATVTCGITVGDEERRPFLLRMDDEGTRQLSDGRPRLPRAVRAFSAPAAARRSGR